MGKSIICILILCALAVGTVFGLPEFMAVLNGGEDLSIEAMTSLIVAVLTLEATVIVAVLIYLLQKKSSENTAAKQEAGAKKIIYTELSAGLETMICTPLSGVGGGVSGQFSDLLIAYLPYIQDILTQEQLHHLICLVDVMTSAKKLEVSEDGASAAEYVQGWLSLFVEDRFIPAMRSRYASQFIRLDDYRRVLTALTRSVLEGLSGERMPPAAGNRLTSLDGATILEVGPNGYTKIYNERGECLCDAILDTDAIGGYGIEAGWAKTDHYDGEFKDGRRHGRGCSYSFQRRFKIFDGQWEDDEPKRGSEFNIVFEKDPDDGSFKNIFPYWDEHSIAQSHISSYLTQRDDLTPEQVLSGLYIAEKVWAEGEEIIYDTKTFYPLSDFMKKYDPDKFARIQKLLF